jgi:EmrB/QacA subfamily drug resistance transporter
MSQIAARAAPRFLARASASKRDWLALGALALVSFLLTLDDTALSVALPSIGRDLGLGLSGLEWVVNAYTLALAGLLLAGGWLADAFGSRRIFLCGLALFSAASLGAGLAPTGLLLIGARVLQGGGAALIMPAALAIISNTFPARQRGLAIGIWAGVSAAGLAIGPLLGAALTQSFGWGSIFLVNVPLGALGMAFGRTILLRSRPIARSGHFDLAGMLAAGAALFALVFALTKGMSYGWASPLILGSFGASALGLVVFIWIEQSRAEPLLELTLFRSRNLSGANAVSLLSTAVMCGIFFFISLYLQVVRGYTATEAGAAFLPMTLLICLVAPAAGRLSDRTGRRLPAASGMAVLAGGLFLLSRLGADSGFAILLIGLMLAGLGIGLTTAPVTAAALDFAPPEAAGVRAGILNTSRMIGLAIGIALMGAIVTARWPGGLAGAATDPRSFVNGLSVAFLVNTAIALAAATLAAMTIAGGRAARVHPVKGISEDHQTQMQTPSVVASGWR